MTAILRKQEPLSEVRQYRRHQHLLREGETPEMIFRLEEGWACRYRALGGGRRQITALFLPGEYCEPQWLLGDRNTHAIVALTALRVRGVPLARFAESPFGRKDAERAMLAATLRVLQRQFDWIAALGRQTAFERLCALLHDLFERMRSADRVINDRCAMPLTQADLADVTGLTPVHVNRVLKLLRAEGLVELGARSLRIPDPERLRAIGAGQSQMR
jgi:CRP-like cAMP-binding protein